MLRKPKPSPKLIINKTVEEVHPYDFEGDALEVHKKISAWIAEYGPTIKIEWDADNWEPHNDRPTPIFRIVRSREETDEEFTQRLDKLAVKEAEQHAREVAEFNRLKAKLEGKK